MAIANHRVRVFLNVNDLEQFIRTDTDISSIVRIIPTNNGSLLLLYDIT